MSKKNVKQNRPNYQQDTPWTAKAKERMPMDKIKKAIKLAENERLQNLSTRELSKHDFIEPDAKERETIKRLILAMDVPRQNLLFFVYGYGCSFQEVEDLLGVDKAETKLRFISSYLAELLGYESKFIAESALEELSLDAMKVLDAQAVLPTEFIEETQSKSFTTKRKGLQIFSNKVASGFAACLVLAFLLIGTNALADGKIITFITEKFEQYSSFIFQSDAPIESIPDISLELGYIPDGYKLVKTKDVIDAQISEYRNSEQDKFVFVISKVSIDFLLDTEEAQVEEIDENDEKVYLWERRGLMYLVSSEKGIAYHIYGDISREEILNIHEHIRITYD